MNKVPKIILVVALLVAVLLSGCSLSASKRPAGDPTATSELKFMTETPGGEGLADDIAKQTQAAQQPAVVTETPVPAAEEPVQPAPEATQAPAQEQQQEQQQQQQQAVSVPTLTRPSTYTLQKGEFPYCIARRYDLDISSLLSANGLSTNSKPGVGTVLKIPSSGSWNESTYGKRALRAHTDFKVGAGDTIYSIACYFGDVSPEAIIAVNGLSGPGDISAGMTLKIP
jgi:LysM repeat protein